MNLKIANLLINVKLVSVFADLIDFQPLFLKSTAACFCFKGLEGVLSAFLGW